MTPAITIYTDNLPEKFGGLTRGPFVFIRPKYRDDKGLHAHEYTHVKQWWGCGLLCMAALTAILHLGYGMSLAGAFGNAIMGFAAFPLLYAMFDPFKLWCEVQAYRRQLSCYTPERRAEVLPVLAGFLANKYGFKITQQQAEKLLNF